MTNRTAPDEARLRDTMDQQGYVVLRGILEPEVVQRARTEMARLVDQQAEKLLAAGKIKDPCHGEPFETRLARLYETCMDDAPKSFRRELHVPGLFGLFFHPGLLDLVDALLGGEIRLYPNYTARPKLPDWEGTLVLWHQDGGYTEGNVDALRMVNVWTPLVPAGIQNGCMEFIPGTHKLGAVPHEKRQHYLEIAREYLEPRLSRAVPIELDPGDIVLFHNLLFHRGLPNQARTIRWSLDWRYQDATQPTMRPESGHIARSRRHPGSAVQSAEEWARLTFG